MEYRPTIGLEVHAELKTRTKMFCDSKNDPDERRPNVNVCPVCMAHPGTLPSINKEAVRHVLKLGVAIGGELADYTEFDRKNYFYPDLPKGYQISQYKYPLVSGGELADVAITRVHLEEDTARSTHSPDGHSLVDFNRAGVPLMELVTEPVVTSAEEAGTFARELQLLIRTLGAGDANMEKGEMRVEANISVSREDTFGTKVEVKNLNSFRSVERAIRFEADRQVALLEDGGSVVQETRGWDEVAGKTFSQRLKEESHDYRYFPDPDLPSFKLSAVPEFSREALQASLPELPWAKRARLVSDYDIKESDAALFVQNSALGELFEAAIENVKDDTALVQTAANYLTSDLTGLINSGGYSFDELELSPIHFATLIGMVRDEKISSRGAKDILAAMVEKGGDPETIAKERGLLQQSDAASLEPIIESVLAEHEAVAEEYKNGKESSLQFLVGQVMKATKGSANPKVTADLLKEKLQG